MLGVREVVFCGRCLMPNTRPRIAFDKQGVCNACHYADEKWHEVDWQNREEEFRQLIEPYRSKGGEWDCVVPWSGGKDSSAIAYKLKYEHGMNPLLATFAPQIPLEVGNHNREALLQAGFDQIQMRPNQAVHRKLARRFFIERGNPKVPWEAGVNALPVKVAIDFNIPLVFFAEHGESEYGGKVLHNQSNKMRDMAEILENQVGDDPRNWLDEEVQMSDLQPYLYQETERVKGANVQVMYFGYYFKWSSYENFLYIKDKIDFKTCAEGRTEGTFTDFDSLDDKMDNLFYYMQFIKFGFGRAVRDASRMIQNRQLTREEGLNLARKYDHEFPARYLPEVLSYLKLTEKEFYEIVDKHRNEEIWEKGEGGEWKLRYPLR